VLKHGKHRHIERRRLILSPQMHHRQQHQSQAKEFSHGARIHHYQPPWNMARENKLLPG
jgi:hypothetical protein